MPETAWLCWKCVCHAFNGPSYWMWMSNRDQWTANLLLENKVNSSGSPEFSGISSFDRRSRITKRKDISYGIAIKIIMLICIQVRQKGPETSKAYSPLSLVPLLQMTHPKVSYGFCPHPHLKKLPHCLFPNHNRFFFFFFVWAWGIRKFLGWGSNPSHSSSLSHSSDNTESFTSRPSKNSHNHILIEAFTNYVTLNMLLNLLEPEFYL